MVKKIFNIAALVLFFSLNSFAQNISATASIDKSNYQVGDYIYYTIKVDYSKGMKVFLPFIKDSLRNVSIIKKESPVTVEEKNGRETSTFKYILSGYDSTGVNIPSIPVLYQFAGDTTMRYVLTNPVGFTIRTLKINPNGDIKDVKAPMTIPLDWWWIAFWILLVIILVAAAYYFYNRYKKKKLGMEPVRKVIKLPAYTIALNALHELEDKKLWQNGKVKEYHSEITEIIRRYFEERFELPALELTTSEAVEMLKQRKETESILDLTYNFLSNADMVKFAKFVPLGSVNEEMLRQAYEIVHKTIPAAEENQSEVETTGGINEEKTEVSDVR